ncbi:hypothetical protein [Haladaptatus sp. AB643]|nr:hypothetical protein [Haladaptatus sp. AB643]
MQVVTKREESAGREKDGWGNVAGVAKIGERGRRGGKGGQGERGEIKEIKTVEIIAEAPIAREGVVSNGRRMSISVIFDDGRKNQRTPGFSRDDFTGDS